MAAVIDGPNYNSQQSYEWTEDLDFLKSTGRWSEIVIPTSQKQFFIIVAVIYGYAGASSNTKDYHDNERLIGAALRRAKHFSNMPYYLGGDFNIDPADSKVLTLAKAAEWVTDLAETWVPYGETPGPTYRLGAVEEGMSGSGTTRIDTVLTNNIGRHLVINFQYDWKKAVGYDHVPMTVQLNIEAFKQLINVLNKPKDINIDAYDPKIHTHDIRTKLWETLWEEHNVQFQEAVQKKNIEEAHSTWCKCADLML